MSFLAIESLSLQYPGRAVAAVDGFNIDIQHGEFIALVGPSGCGKTTTLRLLAGFLRPDSGRISVNGELLSSAGNVVPPESRGMGMVFQNYAVWPHMTVFQNVAFGLQARHMKKDAVRQRVLDMLRTVKLEGQDRVYPARLSGGQQQRVALARALVFEPNILLLDEPLSNLDARLRGEMRLELKELQRRTGITFVYVTHDQTEAMVMADRIAIMAGGRLQQLGTPAEVYHTPANRFVADFMGSVNLLTAHLLEVTLDQVILRLLDSPLLTATLPREAAVQAAGINACLAIRPEDIAIGPRTGAAGELPASIRQATFLGNLNEYWVSVEASGPAAPLTLRVQTAARERYTEGQTVAVTLEPDGFVLLPAP